MLSASPPPQSYSSCCSGEACPVPIRSLRLFLKHLPRICSLALYIKQWVCFDIVDTLRRHVPLLQRLTLLTPSGLYGTAYMQPVVHFHQHLLLRELTLCSFSLPWAYPTPFRAPKSLRSAHPSVLRSATLRIGQRAMWQRRWVSQTMWTPQMMERLQLMPGLRSLVLENAFYPSALGLASLPKLQRLVLLRDCVSCGRLLNSLELSSSSRMTLS